MQNEIVSSGDPEADLIASLINRCNGNIQSVIALMEKFSLEKAKKIVTFWDEITLPVEAREKRVREKADKAAQKFHEDLFEGKLKKENVKIEDNSDVDSAHSDPKSLDRFLDLGIDPSLLNINTSPTPQNTKP